MATVKQKREAKNREEDAVAFYISKGWTPEQSLAIVGNLIHESNLSTTVLGTADDKGSRAIAQWHGDRLKKLQSMYGDKWTDFNNQLSFVDWELRNTHKSAGDKLRASKGVWEAGRIVSDDYEKPKVKFNADERRQQHVSDLAMRLKGIVVTPRISYENNVAPYLNQEQQTTAVNQLEIPIISSNFAGVSDAQETEEEKEDKQPLKEAGEVQKQTNEYNFLKDYQEQYAQQQEQPIQIPTIDVEQTVNEVSQFVDADITAQQGLRRPFKLQDERNLVQKDNTSTQKPNITINKKELGSISAYATKNNISIKDAAERLYNANQHAQNNQVRTYTPQTTKSRVWEVATHPMTAAGYVARNEELPENFSRGQINPHEMAVNMINPFFYADQAEQAIENTSEGNFTEAGMNALNLLPIAAEYQTIGRGLKALNTERLVSNIGQSKNARQVVGSLTGIPPESALPRLLPEELKIYRQVQDIGRMRATGKPISEQYKYAIEKGIPEEHLQKIFNKSKNEIENAIGTPQVAQSQTIENIDLESFFARPQRRQITRDDLRARMRQWDSEIEDSGQISYDRDNVIRHTLEDNSNQLAPPPQELILDIFQNNRRGRVLLPNNQQPQSVFKNTTREIKELGQFTKEEIKNVIKDFSSEYPTYRGVVSENVPSLSLSGSGSLKNVSNKVAGEATSGISSGDIFTGSLNTSHSSYLPQLKQVFKYTDGKPNFLGYKPMNEMGFLSDYNYSADDIAKYLNTEIDTQIGRGVIPKNIQRPFVKKNSVLLPHYGIKQFQQGGTVKSDNEWLQNWYQNRVIPNKDIQGAYLEDKPIYLDRLKNIPPVTKVNMIDNNPNKTGQYNENTGELLLTPKAQPSVYTHEVNHYLNQFPSTMRTVHENIVEQNMYKKGDPRLGVNNEHYDYLRNPDEIHSRIQVLRKDAGFKPNEEVTQEKLLKYLQNYKGNDENILQIMNLTDEKGLLEMLNYMAYNPKKEKGNIAQQGVIKDQEGQRKYPNQPTEIKGNKMATDGYGDIVLYTIPDKGSPKIVMPNTGEHVFKGATKFTEYPITKEEQLFLQEYLKYKK